MPAEKLELQIVTPERRVLAENVDEVVLPSIEGSMGVLPGHAPLMAKLDVGPISYRVGKDRRFLAVSAGFAEVLRDRVTILAETCELAEEIDVDRARLAQQQAEAELKKRDSAVGAHTVELKLKRAINRIKAHDHKRSG